METITIILCAIAVICIILSIYFYNKGWQAVKLLKDMREQDTRKTKLISDLSESSRDLKGTLAVRDNIIKNLKENVAELENKGADIVETVSSDKDIIINALNKDTANAIKKAAEAKEFSDKLLQQVHKLETDKTQMMDSLKKMGLELLQTKAELATYQENEAIFLREPAVKEEKVAAKTKPVAKSKKKSGTNIRNKKEEKVAAKTKPVAKSKKKSGTNIRNKKD